MIDAVVAFVLAVIDRWFEAPTLLFGLLPVTLPITLYDRFRPLAYTKEAPADPRSKRWRRRLAAAGSTGRRRSMVPLVEAWRLLRRRRWK